MPTLDVSQLNVVLGILGAFIVIFGFASVKIKQGLYLGEALPAFVLGIIVGPAASRFIDSERWGTAEPGQSGIVTLGVTRVVIGIQLVIVGFQLPAKYVLHHWKHILVCLAPIMTIMWLFTTLCILTTIPDISFAAALAIASSVTCTDPILSQAVAKGPFADEYVARPLREIISAEAGLNDGFGLPFLMLAMNLMRYDSGQGSLIMRDWFLDTWLYSIIFSAAYGAIVGFSSGKLARLALNSGWIDVESYSLLPIALGMFLLGTCGAIGTDDLLACAVAGNALNWDGEYLCETERRNDEVSSCLDVLLNFGGFMYIGTVVPWAEFNSADVTGISIGHLFLLGFMVLVLRRIPALFLTYKLLPSAVANWKEALFMGYFGPIGIGAVFYVEHIRQFVAQLDQEDKNIARMVKVAVPVIYWLVLVSIVVHGLSIPALNVIYRHLKIKEIRDDAVRIRRKSIRIVPPVNAVACDRENFLAYNRFSRPNLEAMSQEQQWEPSPNLHNDCARNSNKSIAEVGTIEYSSHWFV